MQEHSSAAIEFTTGGNPTTYSAKIYPDGITVNASEYAEWLFLALGKNVEGYTELCNRKESLILRIDKLNKNWNEKRKSRLAFGKRCLVLLRICLDKTKEDRQMPVLLITFQPPPKAFLISSDSGSQRSA